MEGSIPWARDLRVFLSGSNDSSREENAVINPNTMDALG